jgi:hypothetical protein
MYICTDVCVCVLYVCVYIWPCVSEAPSSSHISETCSKRTHSISNRTHSVFQKPPHLANQQFPIHMHICNTNACTYVQMCMHMCVVYAYVYVYDLVF